jgi:hypothetical protein
MELNHRPHAYQAFAAEQHWRSTMSNLRRVHYPVLLAALVLAFACDSAAAGPPAEFPFAAVTPDCGPADGPAAYIYLVPNPMDTLPPPARFVGIYVWWGRRELNGRTLTVGGDHPEASAAYYDGTGGPSTNLHGAVTIAWIQMDSLMEGNVDLASDSTFAVRGRFHARWIPRPVLCG